MTVRSLQSMCSTLKLATSLRRSRRLAPNALFFCKLRCAECGMLYTLTFAAAALQCALGAVLTVR